MDTLTRGQRNLILFILGVCILFFPIRYFAVAQFDEKKSIEATCAERTSYYNELKEMDENRAVYLAAIEDYKAGYESILAEFPADLYQENTIMYLQGIKDEYSFDFPTVTLGEESLFYTLGTGASGDATLEDDTTTAAVGDTYECYAASFPTTYESASYDSIKDVVTYIEDYEYQMSVDSIDISYDEEDDVYSGKMTFTAYSVNGGDRTTEQVDVTVQTGKSNIFAD